MAMHCLVEPFEDQVRELPLHELEIDVLQNAARLSFYDADIVDSTRTDSNHLLVHQ